MAGWLFFIIIFIFFTVFGCLLVLLSFECINWQQMDCRRRQPPLGLQLSAVDLLFNAGFLYFAPSSISGLQTVILYLQLDCLIYLIFNLPMFTEGNLLSKSKSIFLFHWPSLQSLLRWHLTLIKIQTLIRVLVVYPSLCLFQEVTQTFPIEVTTVRITNQQSLQTSEKGWIFAFFSLEKIPLCQPYGRGLFTNWHARFEILTLALWKTWFRHFFRCASLAPSPARPSVSKW